MSQMKKIWCSNFGHHIIISCSTFQMADSIAHTTHIWHRNAKECVSLSLSLSLYEQKKRLVGSESSNSLQNILECLCVRVYFFGSFDCANKLKNNRRDLITMYKIRTQPNQDRRNSFFNWKWKLCIRLSIRQIGSPKKGQRTRWKVIFGYQFVSFDEQMDRMREF